MDAAPAHIDFHLVPYRRNLTLIAAVGILRAEARPTSYRDLKVRPNMRNLRAIRRGAWEHPGPIAAVCWDPANDEVICAVGPSSESSSIELFRVDDKGTEM